MILDFIRSNRRLLAELEEARTRAVYSILEYSREQAKILVDIAEKVISLLKTIEEKIFGSGEQD